MGEKIKKFLFGAVFFIFIAGFAYAASPIFIYSKTNDTILGDVNGLEMVFTKYGNLDNYARYYSDSTFVASTQVGDYYILDVDRDKPSAGRLHKLHADGSSSSYIFQNQAVTIKGTPWNEGYELSIFKGCNGVSENEALSCWIGATYKFSQTALFILSLGAVIAAGILYMTSMGDPNRIGLAKKLLIGAASAIAIIVLGRFFLTKVIGVPWPI